ncbi:Sec-independent protein translocase protein TatB [Conchiformibius steedae]|uniref:Sec-independent protein translocase protein TatB n=1 Tax=Conchiformibius steedae TaxID=153493 RepID=A0A3P2A1W8_9NEIS|nr:Sec-independent protein translocase protein TatB [Conchiformibius steedae]RRD88866.1 twin-arginine translocase subunit TatB [Conchiformibius steedae]
MFELSFSEMLVAGAVALVVLGPERLPQAARTAGQWVGKIRRMAGNVKGELMRQGEYAELAQIKTEFEDAAADIRDSLHDTLPAWERLPEPRTPADFGLDEHGVPNRITGLQVKSVYKQSLARKRDLRRRPPRLRIRR